MLYTEEQRKVIKKRENHYYYKLRKDSKVDQIVKSNKEIKEAFITGLTTLKVCDFNYFITLTIDPKKQGRVNILKDLHNSEIREVMVHFPEMEKYLLSSRPKRISIDFINNASTAYFNYLLEQNIISNVLTALEKDLAGRWHVHALITSTSPEIETQISNMWHYGRAKIKAVGKGDNANGKTKVEHREKIIRYMYETFNPTSSSNIQQKRIDYWYLKDFNLSTTISGLTLNSNAITELKHFNEMHFNQQDESLIEPNIKQFLDILMPNMFAAATVFKISAGAIYLLITLLLKFI